MSRIRVALFENRAQVEAIRQRLVQGGVAAEIHDELGLAKLWFVSRRQAGVRLEVPTKDAERSTQLLLKWDEENGCLQNAVRCPECRSLRIDYPQCTHKSLSTNLAMGLMAELRLVEREYYCEDCHCMWAKPGDKPRRVRAHAAPEYFLEDVGNETAAEPIPSQTKSSPACLAARHGARFGIFKRWRRTPRVTSLLGALLLVLACGSRLFAAGTTSSSTNSTAPTYLRDVLPILIGKCTRCHEEQSQFLANWLDYKTAAARRWEIKRRVWDSSKGAFFKQPMPTWNSPESQAMTEEDRITIRDWVESGAPYGQPPVFGSVQTKAERIEHGKRLFTTVCSVCHQPTGQGIPGRFPPLAGSDFLNSDKHRAIKVVVNGLQGEVVVNGQKFNNSMPKFPLNDQEIASALTYVYNSFGNSGRDVTPEEVKAARGEKDDLNINGPQHAKATEAPSPYE